MIPHENIVGMAKDCNIKDEAWIVNILNKITDISQQNRFSHQPFRIKKIARNHNPSSIKLLSKPFM